MNPKPDRVRKTGVPKEPCDLPSFPVESESAQPLKTRALLVAPYVFLHVGCLGLLWVGWSWFSIGLAAAFYMLRMFAITAFYHRYFSHRAFRTSRFMQFVFALLGNTSMQRGALWWAATHRHHHLHADEVTDKHSPARHGLYWSHLGWLTDPNNVPTDFSRIPDLAKYPELRFLDKYDYVGPIFYGAILLLIGALVAHLAPEWGASVGQVFIWGFFVSTVVLLHATLCINSLAHKMGSRRFETTDDSRNSLFLALLTLGEGWHNNHHRYAHSARQGFYWWEIDLSYYGLKLLSWLGLVWDLRPVPASIYKEAHHD
ncbi:MAG: acyl-CoA desaturase [Verrucomicrobiales bacterium]